MSAADVRVEVAARAIYERRTGGLWSSLPDALRDNWRDIARAAVDALKGADTADSCSTCVREGGPYRCCPHCVDDPAAHEDGRRNHHDLPCSLCVVRVPSTDTAGQQVQRVLDLANELNRVAQGSDGITATVYRQNADRIRDAVAGSRPDDSEAQ